MTAFSLIDSQSRTAAYCNLGRWIADCPRRDCHNALKLQPKQSHMHCGGEGGCQLISTVDWPSDIDEIERVLAMRPVPGTRNWAPAGHRQARAVGFPEGQSVADLIDENHQHLDGGR